MRVCVIGSTGLVGKAFTSFLQTQGIPIFTPKRNELDITQHSAIKKFFREHTYDYIINCAAYTNVDGAEEDAELAYAINAEAPSLLAQVAVSAGARFMHFSTDYVFDGRASSPYKETDLCQPINTYGKTKKKGEDQLIAIMPQACVIRTSWVFGKGGKNFVSAIVRQLESQDEVRAVTDQRGKPTYVMDLVRSAWDIRDASGVFHIAGGTELSRFQIAEDVHRRLQQNGMPISCRHVLPVTANAFPTRALRPPYSALNTEKVEKYLGRRLRTWDEFIEEYLNDQR